MFVNAHSVKRLGERLPASEAARIIEQLERAPGEPGKLAIVLARVTGHRGDQRAAVEVRASNGDTVVAIVEDGEVTTVYYRRSENQSLTATALGVEKVVRWMA